MNEKQIDYIIGLIVDGKEAEAVFKLLTLRRSLTDTVARPGPTTEPALPNLRPLKRKRRMSKDVACPTCKAKPMQPCFEMSNRGPHSTPTDVVRAQGYHKSRAAKAKEVS